MQPLERNLQKSVLGHLKKVREKDPGLVYRKRHGSVGAMGGDPDVYGLYHGIHFEIELKREGRKATELQKIRLQEWGEAGAFVTVIHSTDELRIWLEKLYTNAKCRETPEIGPDMKQELTEIR